MFNNQEINEEDKEYFKTLNKDILLSQSSNNLWDFSWNEHDLNEATELDSLQCGIINACLTSWNYMNRYGNPTYAEYGNRAYLQLKQNKSSMNTYKIKVFFEEVLERMRRVSFVNELTVDEDEEDPYKYNVYFNVTSINNEVIDGDLSVSSSTEKSDSFINLKDVGSKKILIKLYNEYGSPITDEVLHIYEQSNDDEDLGITESTNQYGVTSYTYKGTTTSGSITLKCEFEGNSLYNDYSKEITINID